MGLMSVNDRLHNPNCNVPICQFELLLGLSLIVSVDIVIRHGRSVAKGKPDNVALPLTPPARA